MRYGREYGPIDPAAVETPEANVNTFISELDNKLYGKLPDESIIPLSGGGSDLLATDAVNEGTADAVTATIDGVAAYNSGDVYFLFMSEANTGAMTIDINGIGVKDIKFGGNLDLAMTAGQIEAGTVNVFIYNGTAFEFIGKVDGDKVVYSALIDKADADAIAAGADAAISLLRLPAYSNLRVAVAKAGAQEFSGGGATAVTVTVTETQSGFDIFGGAVNVFTGAEAANAGGWSNGIKTNTTLPNTTGLQRYEFKITATGANYAALTQGQLEVEVHWDRVTV